MQIPPNILKEVNGHITDDGFENTRKSVGIGYIRMRRAVDSGKCSSETLKKLVSFLKKKKKQLEQIESDFN